jgi:hypothetical protein
MGEHIAIVTIRGLKTNNKKGIAREVDSLKEFE